MQQCLCCLNCVSEKNKNQCQLPGFNHIIHLHDIYTGKKLMRLEMPSVCWWGIRCHNKQLRMHWRYRGQSLSSRELGRQGQWLTEQSVAASMLLPQSDTHGFSSHALVQPSYPSGQRNKPKRGRISSFARVTWSAAFRARIRYGNISYTFIKGVIFPDVDLIVVYLLHRNVSKLYLCE